MRKTRTGPTQGRVSRMEARAPFAAQGSAIAGRAAAAVVPTVLIVALFFLWGVANNLNDV